jgi:hypothetical protein
MSHDVHWHHAIDCVVCVVKLPHVEKFSLLLPPPLLLFLTLLADYSTHHQQPLFPHLEHTIEVLCYLVIAVFVCIFLAGCFFREGPRRKCQAWNLPWYYRKLFKGKVGDFCRHPQLGHIPHGSLVISKPDRVMV